jgi:hypothetical protein
VSGFEVADKKIGNLLKQLCNKNVCGHCAAHALVFHAASLATYVMGYAKTIEMFEYIIATLHENNVPVPDPSKEMH